MDTELNRLFEADPDFLKRLTEPVEGGLPSSIMPVPSELMGAARRTLGGKKEVFISKTSGGKLSRWAAKQRKMRRKMAKASRKRNRQR